MTSQQDQSFQVRYWGTRGTLPAAGAQFLKYGGNTNCTEVTCGGKKIIFDAGTGIRNLGAQLAAARSSKEIHLFLTHAHYDHIEGIPFFAPFFSPETKINVYCGPLDGSGSTKETVLNLMRRPYFPVGPDVFVADVSFIDLRENEHLDLADNLKISTLPLNHPGGATGYRVDFHGKSFGCITDTEHVPGKIDQSIVDFVSGIDHFLYDASLTDAEFPEFAGYGHSTIEEGIRIRAAAGAKGFSVFHHMPFRTDDELTRIEQMVMAENTNNCVAREGQIIIL